MSIKSESVEDNSRSIISTAAKAVIDRRIGISSCRYTLATLIEQRHKVAPKTRPIFAIFEPTALPIASSPAPVKAAEKETKISGEDVPIDTMVRPTRMGLIPKFCAIAAAPLTKRSELKTSTMNPTIIANAINISSFFLLK